MGILNVHNCTSVNVAPAKEPKAVDACSNLVASQSCPWNSQIVSVAAGTTVCMRLMVPSFCSFIIDPACGCGEQPQSCMSAVGRAVEFGCGSTQDPVLLTAVRVHCMLKHVAVLLRKEPVTLAFDKSSTPLRHL